MSRLRHTLLATLFSVALVTATAPPAPALDNGLAPTPPMGWNSWNQVRCYGLTEDVVRDAADALVATGMRDAGYTYVVVDDCWQAYRRAADGSLQANPDRFPSGIKALADYVHARGLKFGIYSVPGSKTCAMTWDGYPGKDLGSLGHEEQDARTFAAWGVDYLKYDWCQADQHDGIERQSAFATMRDALAATGRPIVYSISEYGETQPWTWARPIANLWRTTSDIRPTWPSIASIIDQQASLHPYAGPGGWNDPDMLQVGNGALTLEENRTHFSMWAMLSAPLMAGNDLTRASREITELLTQRDVIAVNQDPVGAQARRVRDDGDTEVWAKPLQGGDIAVALLNRGTERATIPTSLHEVGGQEHRYLVRDLWRGRATGTTDGPLDATVAAHGTTLLRLTPTNPPQ